MASAKQQARDAAAQAKGFPSYYAYRNSRAQEAGYASYTDQRQRRAAGDYAAGDPAAGSAASRRQVFKTDDQELRRTTQGLQGVQNIATRMGKLPADQLVAVTFTMKDSKGKLVEVKTQVTAGQLTSRQKILDAGKDAVTNGYREKWPGGQLAGVQVVIR